MLPKGIFGFYSEHSGDLVFMRTWIDSRLDTDETVRYASSGDHRCLLGFIGSTINDYPACVSISEDASAIGVFDGVVFDAAAFASQPQLLSGMPKETIAREANGMFLAASYRKGTLRVLSDPWATLPLYYTGTEGRYAFSVCMEMLLAWRGRFAETHPDDDGVSQYLSFGRMLNGTTHASGVRKLGPARILEVDTQHARVRENTHCYYTPRIEPAEYPSLQSDITESFRAAVQKTLQLSGGNAVTAISGGMDSRTIAAVLAHERPEIPFVTHFTHEGNDLIIAREAARRLSLQHVELQLPAEFDLRKESPAFISSGNGFVPFNNIHADFAYRHYAKIAPYMIDGNHTWIEGRWFMRNSAGRAASKDAFFEQVKTLLLQHSVLDFVRDPGKHRRRAEEQLREIVPDPHDYADSACAADDFFVRHILSHYGTELALSQNHYLRYVSPYFDREYVDLVSRVSSRKRWLQSPQQHIVRSFAPQLRSLPRSYAEVLSWPTDNPWLLRAPVAFERVYDRLGLSRWPRLNSALSRRRPSVVYDIRLPDDPDIFSIDDTIFDAARIRGLLTDNGPVLRDPALVRLLQHILR